MRQVVGRFVAGFRYIHGHFAHAFTSSRHEFAVGLDLKLPDFWRASIVRVWTRLTHFVIPDLIRDLVIWVGWRLFRFSINVTDEETKGYTMDPSFPTMYELSGRRINLGLRMEF